MVEHVPEMIRQLISEEVGKAASVRLSGAARTQPVQQQDLEMGEHSNRPLPTPQREPVRQPPTPLRRIEAAAEGAPGDGSDSMVDRMNAEDEEYWRKKLQKAGEKRRGREARKAGKQPARRQVEEQNPRPDITLADRD